MPITKRRPSLEQIIKDFEKRQTNLIKTIMAQIMALFDEKVTTIAFLYAQRRLIGNRFLPKDIRETIERISNTVNAKTREIIINGISRSWKLADKKNDEIVRQIASSGKKIPPGKKLRILSATGGRPKPTITAIDEYIKRKTEGLGLSKRIWKLSPSFKKSVNDTMIEGLKEGTPSKGGRGLGAELRKNLRRNEIIENPGRGIYRSPQKNAERVARSEINMAYANADFQRWQLIDSVIGIEVRLSNNHPRYDICDEMDGKYPKDFHFIKWHPQCRCIAIPILAPQDIRDAIMDFKLGLIDKPPVIPYIKTMPASAIGWMKKNAERVNGWKSKPYWISANKEKVGKFFE